MTIYEQTTVSGVLVQCPMQTNGRTCQ